MNEYKLPFEKLEVWQEARQFVKSIYALSKKFPDKEKFGLEQQIKRSAISIAANIAEGSSRTSSKDQAHFTQIAYGSLMETACLITLGEDLGYFTASDKSEMYEQVHCLANKLNALRKYQLSRIT